MYEEQVRHGRHHETLRSQSTHLIVAISAALLAFLSSATASADRQYVLGVFVFVLNVYGLIMSLKHYERSRLHVTVAGKYREVISKGAPIGDAKLDDSRRAGHESHSTLMPWVSSVRAYVMWSGLHLVLALLGAFFCFAD